MLAISEAIAHGRRPQGKGRGGREGAGSERPCSPPASPAGRGLGGAGVPGDCLHIAGRL
ncbi:hypothetical protein BY996DRAFT_6507349 [Phakopsora pachyrhizi]|nr:hypothetical protein BY996DRAFT_6554545 [Phakopsora pachyrhizi]KAI8444278.1 hypothetical protein BY996DRAFT_6507349 [Phakopsora pachyrhizi]